MHAFNLKFLWVFLLVIHFFLFHVVLIYLLERLISCVVETPYPDNMTIRLWYLYTRICERRPDVFWYWIISRGGRDTVEIHHSLQAAVRVSGFKIHHSLQATVRVSGFKNNHKVPKDWYQIYYYVDNMKNFSKNRAPLLH